MRTTAFFILFGVFMTSLTPAQRIEKIKVPRVNWKVIIGSIGNKQLKLNKSIVNSGYRIPKNLEY